MVGCVHMQVRGDYSLALPVADHYGGGVDPSTQPWRRPTTTGGLHNGDIELSGSRGWPGGACRLQPRAMLRADFPDWRNVTLDTCS